MMEGRASPHLQHPAVASRTPFPVVIILRRRRGLPPGCPETPHGAPVQRPCYGRENVTVSHLRIRP